MPMDFTRLLHLPNTSASHQVQPKPSNRPEPPMGSGNFPIDNIEDKLTPRLAAMLRTNHARTQDTNTIAPRLLMNDPVPSHNGRSELHHHNHPLSNSPDFHAHSRSSHQSPARSITADCWDLDQGAESDFEDQPYCSRNLTSAYPTPGAGTVDLTCGETPSPRVPYSNPRGKRTRSSDVEAGPSSGFKRRKGSGTISNSLGRTRTIDEVDLVDDDDDVISTTLQKQRVEQVQAQQGPMDQKATRLGTLTCTVCLDVPTDLTVTSCGHAFCRDCLMDWLTAGEKQHPKRSNCPACRKSISRTKRLDVIPLEILLKLKKPTHKLLEESASPPGKRSRRGGS